MNSFQSQFRFYRSQHRTVGCKVTHMFGVPMIALSLPALFFNFPLAASLFTAGWALQLIGHYVFEKNKPVLLDGGNPLFTTAAAMLFVAQEWMRFLSGKSLAEPDDASATNQA